MENSQPVQPPMAPPQSPVPQDAEPERKFVMPWKLLIKASIVLNILMFLATGFVFFLSYQATSKANDANMLMQTYIQSGQLESASNMAVLETESRAHADSLFGTFKILALLTGICVIDLIVLTAFSKRNQNQDPTQAPL